MKTHDEPASPTPTSSDSRQEKAALWATGLVIAAFYACLLHFGPQRGESAVWTWWSAWNKESDFEHGWIFPVLLPGLLFWRRKEILAARGPGEWYGMALAIFGALTYLLAYRTIQWRIAIIGLPFVLTGAAWYFWGRRAAWLLAFPFALIWLAIPVGFLQQATGGLQLIATRLGHAGSSLCGVDTQIIGNRLILNNGAGFDVDEGCSGIRSLWALMLIAAAWTYVAKMAFWKKGVLFASVFPIAILGNAMRLISIFVLAKYGGEKFASTTWHDWSPLVFFYPFSLFILLLVQSVLEGGLPWKRATRKEIRRHIVTRPIDNPAADPHLP